MGKEEEGSERTFFRRGILRVFGVFDLDVGVAGFFFGVRFRWLVSVVIVEKDGEVVMLGLGWVRMKGMKG